MATSTADAEKIDLLAQHIVELLAATRLSRGSQMAALVMAFAWQLHKHGVRMAEFPEALKLIHDQVSEAFIAIVEDPS